MAGAPVSAETLSDRDSSINQYSTHEDDRQLLLAESTFGSKGSETSVLNLRSVNRRRRVWNLYPAAGAGGGDGSGMPPGERSVECKELPLGARLVEGQCCAGRNSYPLKRSPT